MRSGEVAELTVAKLCTFLILKIKTWKHKSIVLF